MKTIRTYRRYLLYSLFMAVMVAALTVPLAIRNGKAQSKLTFAVADQIFGHVYTTIKSGQHVNGNIYASKDDVYLNGGPQTLKAKGLPDGDYYFQVTDPNGNNLLSSDAIACRQFTVSGGVVVGGSGACPHPNGDFNPTNGSTPVKLMPFADTPNSGGEYKVWVTPVVGYDSGGPNNGFAGGDDKTDNFKVENVTAVIPQSLVGGIKYLDANGDGVFQPPTDTDPGEAPIAGVTIHIEYGNGQTQDVVTDANGAWSFLLDQGTTFKACENLGDPTVYNQTGPKDTDLNANPNANPYAKDKCWNGTITSADFVNLNFGNELKIVVDFSADTVCQGNATSFRSNVTAGTVATWNWDFGDGSAHATVPNPTHTYATAGTFSVTLTATSPGGNSVQVTHSVTVNPTPDATITTGSFACSGSPGHTASVPDAGANATYVWGITNGTITAGDGTSQITYTAGASGSVGLSVTVTNGFGCPASSSASVQIIPLPNAAIAAAASACPNSKGNLASVANAGAGASYAWTISNGTITAGQGTSQITYTAGSDQGNIVIGVTVTNASGCSSSSSVNVLNACLGTALTQGFYSNTNGQFPAGSGNTAQLIMTGVLSGLGGSMSVGNTASTRAVTLTTSQLLCLQTRLPAGTGPMNLTADSPNFTLANTCNTGSGSTGKQPLDSKGKFQNVLLGQTIALSFNVNKFTGLSSIILKRVMYTAPTQTGTPDRTIVIPCSVLSAINAGSGTGDVAELLRLANAALAAGSSTSVVYNSVTVPISDVNSAVNAINVGFDQGHYLVATANSSVSPLVTACP